MKMKLIAIVFVLFVTNFAFAQTGSYQAVRSSLQQHYNAKAYDNIFNIFSKEMKDALPIEKTRLFFTNLSEQAGRIDSMEFINQNEGYALYKTKFEKAVLGINISLNHQNQINGFFVKPLEKLTKSKNKAVNGLSSYPEKVAETIFSATKDLPNEAQLSIAIIKNGKTSFYGIKKLNDTIQPAQNQNKIFEIGSITKVFTATVLASLVEDKKIKLTDEINQYYPFSFKHNMKLNFMSLANHTSGLPRLPENLLISNPVNPYKNYGKAEIEEYLKNILKPDQEPATTYSYSNLGAGLLGYTMGLSQKVNFQSLLQKRVFDRYKMTSSFTSSKDLDDRLIKGLNRDGKVVANWDFDVLCGAGGILSTTVDLAKFTNAQFDSRNKELELTRRTTFNIKGDTKIALGWHKLTTANQDEMIWHNGGTGGYSSSIVVKIDKKTAVIILSNVFDINAQVDALSFSLLNNN